MIALQTGIVEPLGTIVSATAQSATAQTNEFAAVFASLTSAPSDAVVPSGPAVIPETAGSDRIESTDPHRVTKWPDMPLVAQTPMPAAHPKMATMSVNPTIDDGMCERFIVEPKAAVKDQGVSDNLDAAVGMPVEERSMLPIVAQPVASLPITFEDTPKGAPAVAAQLVASTPAAPEPRIDQANTGQNAAVIAVAGSLFVEPAKSSKSDIVEHSEISAAAAIDVRPAAAMPVGDRPVTPLPERAATFAPILADAVRELAAIAQDKDVRFNVRPEILGPVAVTIERTEAGPTLRLGVETQVAVQALRQAEPTMNDARGHAPFVQVTVDLDAPDSRGRSARAVPQRPPGDGNISENVDRARPVTIGRYA